MKFKFKKHWLPPVIFGAAVLSLTLTVLTIGARSPYTHANLDSKYTSDYNRTTQTLVGPSQPLQAHAVSGNSSGSVGGGSGPAVNTGGAMTAPHGDLTQQGQALFFGLDCASCHGLKGEGGVFAPIIQGVNATEISTNTSAGPGGMPKFAGLTDQDVQALAAYLKSVVPGATASAASSQQPAAQAAAAPTDVVALKKTPASVATDDPAWSGAAVTTVHTEVIPESKATGPVDVKMQALYSETDVWFRFQWTDPTQDAFSVWQWDGTKWTSPSATSDRLSLYWEMQPVADFEARGCQALCHKGAGDPISKWYMVAPNATDVLDNWQWTASTFAGMGGANNLHLAGVNTSDPTTSPGRGSAIIADPNTGGGTVSNSNATKDAPIAMQDPTKTNPLYGPNYLAVSEAVALDISKIKVGDKIPKTELAPFQGERGDIDGKTTYANGQYTVVFHRKLDTGFPDDAKFTVGGTFTFGLAVWNQLDQENHTVTGSAYHLKLQ